MQINQERMGLHIDRDLLKNVLLFFMEINKHKGVSYYEDFERTMLEETATYYSQLAQQMLVCDSSEDYMQKVFLYIYVLYYIFYLLEGKWGEGGDQRKREERKPGFFCLF